MDKPKRIKMVKAMEYIMRNVNDEDLLMPWLSLGVADGDIEYGDLTVSPVYDPAMDYYTSDDDFRDLMHLFLIAMKNAYKSGGLYCDGLCSRDKR